MMTQPLNPYPTSVDSLGFFEQYATELLTQQNQEIKEALRRRHIDTSQVPGLEEVYKISLTVDSTIPIKQVEKVILQQIVAFTHFLKDFHIFVLGQRNSLFHIYEVELIINRGIKCSFSFEAGKLLLHIPYWQLKFLNRYFSEHHIKNLWKRGKHLSQDTPVYKNWWLFNPVGEFRSNLRAILLLAVERQILGIDQLLTKLGLADVGAHKSLSFKHETVGTKNFKDNTEYSAVREAILAFLKTSVDEEKLGVKLTQLIKELDEENLVTMLTIFKKKLADPRQIEEVIEAGMIILKEVIQQEQSQVDIKMFGFVNVSNYHRIDIALNLSSGYFKNYIEVIPRKASIKAVLWGFVNVYTIDDITVKPNFHGAMKLNFETIALQRALDELHLLDQLGRNNPPAKPPSENQ